MEKLVPLLVAERCMFKLACSQQMLRELNAGVTAPATVGKAFTIYPDPDRVRELGLRLARALRGHEGPRVLSDRRILANAPVYYRYGGLTATVGHDPHGRPTIRLRGPAGEEFDGLAGLTYRQPSWVTDPFASHAAIGQDGDDRLLGGRYRVVSGIRQAPQGNVYRAVDIRDGTAVVIKQARAYVAEYGDRNDSRLRVRNERRVLDVLAGVTGVPRFIDHFRHGDDEFLVTSDCGPASLADDVARAGPYRPGDGPRGLAPLATELTRVLLAVHDRGVVIRDLTPANIVVGTSPSLIDFGLAAHAGLHLPGSTQGYAPARQLRNEPPRDTDDLHALGMTLLFATTGLHPVTVTDDPQLPVTRPLQTILRHAGATPTAVIAAIVDLISGDDQRARAAARRIAANDMDPTRPIPALPAPPAVTPDLATQVTAALLDDLLGMVDRVLSAPASTVAANDVSLYTGSAGIGLELLHHLNRQPIVAPAIQQLADFTARVAQRTHRPPGLFGGTTGTDIFLQVAADHGLGAMDWPGRDLPDPHWEGVPDDLIDGHAGVGLGHLYLYRAAGDSADLAIVQSCLRAVLAQPPPIRSSRPGDADPRLSRAHGLAGAVELLISSGTEIGSGLGQEIGDNTAADRTRHLAAQTEGLIADARDPAAEPMTVSWCRGLAGIGRTLLHAGVVLDDPWLVDLARRAADACIDRVPRLSTLGRCCGVAGIGDYLLDIAALDGHRDTGRQRSMSPPTSCSAPAVPPTIPVSYHRTPVPPEHCPGPTASPAYWHSSADSPTKQTMTYQPSGDTHSLLGVLLGTSDTT